MKLTQYNLKMHSIIQKLKINFEKYKFKEEDPLEGLKMLENFISLRYMTFCETINDYMIGRRLLKRHIIACIMNLSIWIYAIRCLLMAIINTKSFAFYIGDYSYLMPRADILNLIIFIFFTTLASIGKNNIIQKNYFVLYEWRIRIN